MKSNIMSKIIINRQVLEDWIKYIDTFSLYPEDRAKLQSILQQGEEYNKNEAIEFFKWVNIHYRQHNHEIWISLFNDGSHGKAHITPVYYKLEDLYKLYKNEKR